jgi:hypothetical protein
MRLRAKTSSREQGPDFDIVGTCEWLSYVRAYGSQAYVVLVRFFPIGCLSIQVTATLSVMSGSLLLQSSRSMIVIFGLEDGGLDDVGYDYVISIMTVFTLPLVLILSAFFLFMLVLVFRCKHNIWLN